VEKVEASDAGLGLYNYKARFYSTVTGRFVSADPIVGSPRNPQSWNAYSYVRNNPLRLVEPSGLDPACFITCTSSGHDLVVDNGRCGLCEALVALHDFSAWITASVRITALPAFEGTGGCPRPSEVPIPLLAGTTLTAASGDGAIGLRT
jgi:RHS repeat-associated protein